MSAERDTSDDELGSLLRQFAAQGGGGADAARRAFYNRTVKAFDRQALLATGYNRELAKQAMQEAWIKIMCNAASFDPSKGKVMTWANTIIMRCGIDELRTYYKHRKLRTALGGGEYDDGATANPAAPHAAEDSEAAACPLMPADETLYQDQVERITAQCIEALPGAPGPNYRLAMELALDPDLTYADMTSMIQQQMPHETINAEQVRGWVRQAVKRMRACVNGRLGWNRAGGKLG